jgi:hypothetical protein
MAYHPFPSSDTDACRAVLREHPQAHLCTPSAATSVLIALASYSLQHSYFDSKSHAATGNKCNLQQPMWSNPGRRSN